MLILTYCSTEYTLNIILRGASASKNALLPVKVFEIVFRVGRYPPFVPRLIKVSLNSRQNCTEKCNLFLDLLRWKQSGLSDYRNTSFDLHLEKVTFLRGAGQSDEVLQSKPGISTYFVMHCNALAVLPSAELHLNFFWSCWIEKRAYIPGNGNCLHHRQCGIIKSPTLVWDFGHCGIFPGWLCKNEIFDPTIIILE